MTSTDIRLIADWLGFILMRNNSGVLPDQTGRPVRYGLGNESSAIMKVRKSSDWIGIAPGGIFAAIEEKPAGWVFRGTQHEVAQSHFIDMVRRKGGFACFATCGKDLENEWMKWQRGRIPVRFKGGA
jgi:hypothetical protein